MQDKLICRICGNSCSKCKCGVGNCYYREGHCGLNAIGSLDVILTGLFKPWCCEALTICTMVKLGVEGMSFLKVIL